MNVVLFGSTGILGSRLKNKLEECDINLHCPTRQSCDITNYKEVSTYVDEVEPDIILHSAGFVNTREAENEPDKCIDVNVIGTYNIIKKCRRNNIRMIYISTEYVFDGTESPYKTTSAINPKGVYGITKSCGELLTKTLDNHLIIRAPFWRSETFNVPKAFTNQYTTRSYVHEVVDDIVKYCLSDEIGIKHVVGKYQSLFDLAKQTTDDVEGVPIPDEYVGILPEKIELLED